MVRGGSSATIGMLQTSGEKGFHGRDAGLTLIKSNSRRHSKLSTGAGDRLAPFRYGHRAISKKGRDHDRDGNRLKSREPVGACFARLASLDSGIGAHVEPGCLKRVRIDRVRVLFGTRFARLQISSRKISASQRAGYMPCSFRLALLAGEWALLAVELEPPFDRGAARNLVARITDGPHGKRRPTRRLARASTSSMRGIVDGKLQRERRGIEPALRDAEPEHEKRRRGD